MESSDDHKESSAEQPQNVPEDQGHASSAGNVEVSNPEYCLPCGLSFSDEAAYTSHSNSEEHAIMVLAIGVSYVEPGEVSSEFPPSFFCLPCGWSAPHSEIFKYHLTQPAHKENTNFLRMISFWKKTVIVGRNCMNKPTEIEDIFDLAVCPPLYCQLCDEQCSSVELFKCHEKLRSHKELEEKLMSCKICNLSFLNSDYYESHSDYIDHETLKNFRIRLLNIDLPLSSKIHKFLSENFCLQCDVKFNTKEFFEKHKGMPLHLRVIELMNKLNLKECGEDIKIYEPERWWHFCEVCNIFTLLSSNYTYEDHFINIPHKRELKLAKWKVQTTIKNLVQNNLNVPEDQGSAGNVEVLNPESSNDHKV